MENHFIYAEKNLGYLSVEIKTPFTSLDLNGVGRICRSNVSELLLQIKYEKTSLANYSRLPEGVNTSLKGAY